METPSPKKSYDVQRKMRDASWGQPCGRKFWAAGTGRSVGSPEKVLEEVRRCENGGPWCPCVIWPDRLLKGRGGRESTRTGWILTQKQTRAPNREPGASEGVNDRTVRSQGGGEQPLPRCTHPTAVSPRPPTPDTPTPARSTSECNSFCSSRVQSHPQRG